MVAELSRLTYKGRVEANAAAILRLVEIGDRDPTPEDCEVLKGFSGAGSIGRIFADSGGAEWEKEIRAKLKAAILPHEWQSLQESTVNAFYTPAFLVKSMWQSIKASGFKRGRVLDIGCGATVQFLAHCPDDIRKNIEYIGVERDIISCKIARKLFPDATFYNRDVMMWLTPVNQFDLVIGNVPFTNGSRQPYGEFEHPIGLHARVLLRAIDLLGPNGMLQFITSAETMDMCRSEAAQALRPYVDRIARFIGAIRLPLETMQEYDTDVTCDLLWLQKRSGPNDDRPSADWLTVTTHPSGLTSKRDGRELEINNYFLTHPDHFIGKPCLDKLTTDRIAATVADEAEPLTKIQLRTIDLLLKLAESTKNPIQQETTMVQMTQPQQPRRSARWRNFTVKIVDKKLHVTFPTASLPAEIKDELEAVQFRYEVDGRRFNAAFRDYGFTSSGQDTNLWVISDLPQSREWIENFAVVQGGPQVQIEWKEKMTVNLDDADEEVLDEPEPEPAAPEPEPEPEPAAPEPEPAAPEPEPAAPETDGIEAEPEFAATPTQPAQQSSSIISSLDELLGSVQTFYQQSISVAAQYRAALKQQAEASTEPSNEWFFVTVRIDLFTELLATIINRMSPAPTQPAPTQPAKSLGKSQLKMRRTNQD